MPNKTTLAYEFVRKPQPEIKILLAQNPQMIDEKDENERYLLHWAALYGRHELCEYILERRPEQLNAEDDMNVTPLILATLGGFVSTVTMLVQAGADINHRNRGGHSALQYACSKGRLDIANFLMECGANFDITDKLGETPLHRATTQGYVHIVEALLMHGANPNIPNKEGNTPLHLACEDNEQSSALLMLKLGANRNMMNMEGKTAMDLASRSMLALIASEVDNLHSG